MENPDSVDTPDNSTTVNESPVKKRPWNVTLLMLLVLIITIINLIRFVLSIRYWSFLSSLGAVSPLYLALTGLTWGVVGAVLIWGSWKARAWAPKLMQAMGLSFALYYWLDQVFLKDHPISTAPGAIRVLVPANWQFAALVTLVILAFMEWSLSRAKVKAYFGTVSSFD